MSESLAYDCLKQEEQKVYQFLYTGLVNHKEYIAIPVTGNTVNYHKIIRAVLSDNPDIIYFNCNCIKVIDFVLKKAIQVFPENSAKQSFDKQKEMSAAADQICRKIMKEYCDDYQRVLAVYKYLQDTVTYDINEMNRALAGDYNYSDAHNAFGALIQKHAVCDGIASALSLLFGKMGIKCMTITGTSAIYGQEKVNHAWNIVEMEGKYYHLDTTWDISKHGMFSEYAYDYFLQNDENMAFDHDWDVMSAPACKEDNLSYFSRNRLFISNMMQLQQILEHNLEMRNTVFHLKIAYNLSLPENTEAFMEEKLHRSATRLGIAFQMQYTWNQNTRIFSVLCKYST